VGPNCTGIAASNPGLAKYITGAIGFPFALLQVGGRAGGRAVVRCADQFVQRSWRLCLHVCLSAADHKASTAP
jgi:hypothetical protein